MAEEGIIFTPKAEEDLRQIFDYISEYSLEAALLQMDRILDRVNQLLRFPGWEKPSLSLTMTDVVKSWLATTWLPTS